MHLADRFTRYKFYLSARTQVGHGEVYAEESPHFSNEGELIHIQHMPLSTSYERKGQILVNNASKLGKLFDISWWELQERTACTNNKITNCTNCVTALQYIFSLHWYVELA